jgi:hypothetical protein
MDLCVPKASQKASLRAFSNFMGFHHRNLVSSTLTSPSEYEFATYVDSAATFVFCIQEGVKVIDMGGATVCGQRQ